MLDFLRLGAMRFAIEARIPRFFRRDELELFGLNISEQEIDRSVAILNAKGTGDEPHRFFA